MNTTALTYTTVIYNSLRELYIKITEVYLDSNQKMKYLNKENAGILNAML